MKKGFTLIELVVAISIVGFLSSIVLATLGDARIKARDAVRQHDLKQIEVALALYHDDNEAYPISPWVFSSNVTGWNNLETTLSQYIPTLPIDSINNATQILDLIVGQPTYPKYGYTYYSLNGTNYWLITLLENTGDLFVLGK